MPSSSSLTFGCTWHVEIVGEPFPNARGASFYEISRREREVDLDARDVVESPMKLGEASFSIIRVVAPLVKEKILAEKKKTGGMAKEEMASSPSSSSSDNMFEVVGLWARRPRTGMSYSYRRRSRQFQDILMGNFSRGFTRRHQLFRSVLLYLTRPERSRHHICR